jgi:hypothetical protein
MRNTHENGCLRVFPYLGGGVLRDVREVLVEEWNVFTSLNTWELMQTTGCAEGYIAEFEKTKQQWKGLFDENQANFAELTKEEQDKVLTMKRESFLTRQNNRFHKSIENLAHHLMRMSINRKSKYQHASQKNRNDSIDINMLQFIPMPVILVSVDDKFRKKAMAAEPHLEQQLLSVEEFKKETSESLKARVAAKAEWFRIHCQKNDIWLGDLIYVA